ncbi:MAG: glyoxylate/hydroxypyruvate reductase A [Alphaproteobacteria bacterium]|nr:glyoxylate/hydroxypyruvate reductase A [Alphaproteobacteria bacterium]MDE2112967.1 glyoxylate/hydroxypyruvate reductase A [Alphaproteobacteria bacterium]MDE2493320.1 glyoxylate/hydroxypyruvate reductase A [Alphaproteobacteria bacterium]
MAKPNLLMIVPAKWSGLWTPQLNDSAVHPVVHGEDAYAPDGIDYVLGFRPPPGLLKTLPKLKAVFSLGAGVDGFLSDPDYPKHIPLVRFVDETLSAEMAQFVLMHVLIHHRHQRLFDAAQPKRQWRQMTLPRRTEDTRIGILGFGEIGRVAAQHLADLGFPVSAWSRTRKKGPGVKSFAGDAELEAFLAQTDILICLLPLTRQTAGILNAKTFAALPQGAFVINVARGGHLIEKDLIAALDAGRLSGAVLDVFQTEPLPETSPLWTHPKVTATPHIAAISQPAVAVRFVLDGIAKFERGARPDNIVDVETAY